MGAMKKNVLHIFKAGSFTPMGGAEPLSFSEADIAASAAAYNPSVYRAPLVIGHPKLDGPAWGYVKSASANAGGLWAEHDAVVPEFAEWVNAGFYGAISTAFWPPDHPNNPTPGVYAIKHVGFLGGTPPAVKGLTPPSFSGADESGLVVVRFGDWTDRSVVRLLMNLRDFLVAKHGQEEADKVLPLMELQWLLEEAAQPDPTPAPAPSFADGDPVQTPPAPNAPASDPNPENPTVTPEQIAELQARNRQLEAELQNRQEQEARDKEAAIEKDAAAFADDLISKGLTKPKHKSLIVQLMKLTSRPGADGQPIEFAEGGVKQPMTAAFKAMLSEAGQAVHLTEFADRDRASVDPKTNPLVADAEARTAKGK
jgi:hypothetical protein